MTELTSNQKSARTARRVGVGGAILIVGLAAWASFVMQGQVNWLVVLLAAFTGVFHAIGCELFVNHFKSLDAEAAESDLKGRGDAGE